MKIKELLNNLPHKKVYVGIGVFVFLVLIAIVVNKTHAYYNSTPDAIPLVNAKVGDFKPKLTKVIINNEITQPQYANNKQVNVYLTWSNEDITQYCLSETNSCTSYKALNETDTKNKKATVIHTFSTEGTKIIYARIKDKYNRESDIKLSTSIIVDITPPTVSKVETSNITETSVTVKITASDTKAGVDKISEIKQYCLTSTKGTQCNATGSFPIDGLKAGTAYNWTYYVEDNAGNKTANQIVSFKTIKPISDLVNVCTSYSNIGECVQNVHLDEIPNLESTSNMNERCDENGENCDTIRRFQSTDPTKVTNNYICFGATSCSDQDDHMYRIIGIVTTADWTNTEVGRLKIIKQTPLSGRYDWNNCRSNCLTNIWNKATLFKQLNGKDTYMSAYPSNIFLTNTKYVPNDRGSGGFDWKTLIAEVYWRYGDVDYYSITANQSGTEILKVEKSWNDEVTAKIGLMNLSDYHLAYDNTTNWFHKAGTSNWLDAANNSGSAVTEWTMSRSLSTRAWCVGDAGILYSYLDNAFWVRPVFYLSEKIQLKEGTTGTIDNPYIIEGVYE